jgi:uncharacterized protein (TIGR03086 family)
MTPDLITAVCASTERVIEGLGPDQYELSTPCTEWNVRQLLNHVLGALGLGAALMTDSMPTVQVGPGQVPGEDLVGDDPLAAYRSAVAAFGAVATPDAIGRMHATPMGEMPGAALAGFATLDVLVHGWDLAKATGQDTRLDAGLAEQMLGFASQAMPDGSPRGPLMAASVAVGSDADATDRLVAFTGRTP